MFKLKTNNIFKQVAITTVAFTSLLVGAAAAESPISTVYHVYFDSERIGTVDDKAIIERAVQEKINTLKTEDSSLELIADNLILVPEQVFRANVNNQETYNRVVKDVKIVAPASALVIDEMPIAYLESEEEVNETINQLKLKYVDKEELLDLQAREKIAAALPPLQEGQSRILDVGLSKKVSISDEKVTPEKILSIDEAVQLLQKGTLEEKKYEVQAGDVLGTIAANHDLTTQELLQLNPGIKEDQLLHIGDELNVTAYKPYLAVNVKLEKYVKEQIKYTYEVKESSDMYKGDQKVQQEGQNGEKLVNYIVNQTNGITMNSEKVTETIIKEPVTHIVIKGTKVVPSRGTGQLSWPAVGGYISSQMGYRWGRQHKGIDIARPSDRTIKAADNGTIASAGWDGGYGNKVVINHNNGLKTVYAHLSSISVKVGQTVSKGQKIGVMGTTGNSTGVHLHFEVYKNGSLVNPTGYFK